MGRSWATVKWLSFTGLPACLSYLTDFQGAATRVDGSVSTIAPVIAAFLPFVAISGATACLGVLCIVVPRIVVWLLPKSKRNRFVRAELYPALVKAIELDRASQDEILNIDGYDRVEDLVSQFHFVSSQLNRLGLSTRVKDSQKWPIFVRRLLPFAEAGDYENVERITENWSYNDRL